MVENQLGHLKHGDLIPPVKHLLQLVVGVDPGLVRGILEAIGTYVVPKLPGDFSARDRVIADHCGQLLVRLHRLHECRTRFAFGLGAFSHNSFDGKLSQCERQL